MLYYHLIFGSPSSSSSRQRANWTLSHWATVCFSEGASSSWIRSQRPTSLASRRSQRSRDEGLDLVGLLRMDWIAAEAFVRDVPMDFRDLLGMLLCSLRHSFCKATMDLTIASLMLLTLSAAGFFRGIVAFLSTEHLFSLQN